MNEQRLDFLESRVTRLEKLLYFIIVLSLPNALTFVESVL
jgi:hypothetical protein